MIRLSVLALLLFATAFGCRETSPSPDPAAEVQGLVQTASDAASRPPSVPSYPSPYLSDYGPDARRITEVSGTIIHINELANVGPFECGNAGPGRDRSVERQFARQGLCRQADWVIVANPPPEPLGPIDCPVACEALWTCWYAAAAAQYPQAPDARPRALFDERCLVPCEAKGLPLGGFDPSRYPSCAAAEKAIADARVVLPPHAVPECAGLLADPPPPPEPPEALRCNAWWEGCREPLGEEMAPRAQAACLTLAYNYAHQAPPEAHATLERVLALATCQEAAEAMMEAMTPDWYSGVLGEPDPWGRPRASERPSDPIPDDERHVPGYDGSGGDGDTAE